MKILVIFDNQNILAWLVDVDIKDVVKQIENGYPELLNGYQARNIKAINIEVPKQDIFNPELYAVKDGKIIKNLT